MSKTQYICVWHDEGTHGLHCPDFNKPRPPEGKPSPLPWVVSANGCISTKDLQTCIAIAPTYGVQEFKIDAQLIVTAVNLHAKLVAALEDVLRIWGYAGSSNPNNPNHHLYEQLEALLAEAKKGELK